MDNKNFSIGVLSVTATILFVGLVIVHTSTSPALGYAQNDRGGDYIISTGQLDSAVELVYVLDAGGPSMAVYHYDPSRSVLVLDDAQDLRPLLAQRGAGK
jgi:hypothetical protein